MKFLLRDFDVESRREYIYTSLGRIHADLLVTNVNIVAPHIGEVLEDKSIVVKKNRVVGLTPARESDKFKSSNTLVLDGRGEYAVPGFIDLHIHIESSMLDPIGFSKIALRHGTTVVVADPHEVANVLGLNGVKLFTEIAEQIPMKILIVVPSCVPATDPGRGLETVANVIGYREVEELLKHEYVIGLGEVMDYISVLEGREDVLKKIEVTRSRGLIVDGHSPMLSGDLLNSYISSGVMSDHETTSSEEAMEKLEKGMWLYVREGSAWRDLKALIKVVKETPCDLCVFVSDDLNVYNLFTEGHMDRIVNLAIEYGVDPVRAIKYATFNPAVRLHMEDQLGLIAPGRYADLFISRKLEKIEPHTVISSGRLIYHEGSLVAEFKPYRYPQYALTTVKLGKLHETISYTPDLKTTEIGVTEGVVSVNTIKVIPGSTLTKRELRELVVENGVVKADPARDVMYVVVADRHKGSGSYSNGFIEGLRFRAGAIAQTIAHDTHNLIIAGWSPRDMELALKEIERIQGGIVIVDQGKTIAEIPLRLAGLMSTDPPEEVFEKYKHMVRELRSRYSIEFEPFSMTLSLISLPVIPEIRITDRGIVDVNEAKFIPLIEEVYRK